MNRIAWTAALSSLILSSTLRAEADFREALRIAFPSTVSIELDQGGQPGGGRIMGREFGQLGGAAMMPGLTSISRQTGFAVASDLIATQLPSSIDEVTITTSAGKELTGTVALRDFVTGLTLIKVQDVELVSLAIDGEVPEPGLPVVFTRLVVSGTPTGELGMIASGPTTIDPQLGYTQYVSANLHASDAGAPIVNAAGVVVGIVGVGLNGNLLCLPTEPLQRLIEANSKPNPSDRQRGLIGIQMSGEPLITSITAESPAQTAGIELGDRVLRVNGYEVSSAEQVLAAVAMARAGDEVPIVVRRGDEKIEVNVTLKKHPRQEFAKNALGGSPGRQRWKMEAGKLVPLDRRFPPGQPLMKRDLEKLLENFPDNPLILPRFPEQLDQLRIEPDGPNETPEDQQDESEGVEE